MQSLEYEKCNWMQIQNSNHGNTSYNWPSILLTWWTDFNFLISKGLEFKVSILKALNFIFPYIFLTQMIKILGMCIWEFTQNIRRNNLWEEIGLSFGTYTRWPDHVSPLLCSSKSQCAHIIGNKEKDASSLYTPNSPKQRERQNTFKGVKECVLRIGTRIRQNRIKGSFPFESHVGIWHEVSHAFSPHVDVTYDVHPNNLRLSFLKDHNTGRVKLNQYAIYP